MRARRWIVLGVIAALCAGLALYLRRRPTAPTGAPASSRSAPAAPASAPGARPARPAATAAPAPEAPVAYEDDPVGTLRLEGQVIDADERPVAGAVILINSNPRRLATTEGDGSFAFDRLVGRSYSVEARKGEGHAGPVTVRLTTATEPIVLRLKEVGGLEISVVALDDHKPIAGASLDLRDEPGGEATTGADGKATLRGVGPTWHIVEAAAPGFAPEAALVEGAGRGATQRTTIELKRGAPVSGKVVDGAGKPVAHARVRAVATASFMGFQPKALEDQRTDAAGRWGFAALPAGSFRFNATHEKHGPGSSPPIALDGRFERKDIVVTLEGGAHIAGVVVRKDGAPVASAVVRVAPKDSGFGGRNLTRQAFADDNGRFDIGGLPRRAVELVASDPSASSEIAALDLSAQPEQLGLRVVLDVGGTIAGIVVDAKGEPVAEAQVVATPEPGSRRDDLSTFRLRGPARDVTDAGGKFALRGLPDGSYQLRASRADVEELRMWQRPSATAQVGDLNVRLTIEDDGRVKGRVLFADGSAPESYSVATGWGVGTTFANADGGFEVEAAAGPAALTASGPSFVQKTASATVKASDTVDIGTITVEHGRSISGRVLGADGAPVPGAKVMAGAQLVGNGSELSAGGLFAGMTGTKTTTSGDDGGYVLSSVGERALVIAADEPNAGRSTVYRVPAGTSSVQIDLPLKPLGALEGRVTKAGQPLASALVIAQPQQAARGTFMVTAGADGGYRFDKLSPDSYLLSALQTGSVGGGASSLRTQLVNVDSGQTAHLDLEVPVGTVAVTITMTAPPAANVHTAQVLLATGTLPSGSADQLGEAVAARGPGSTHIGFIFKDQPARLENVQPGSYSACAVPIPGDISSMADTVKLRDKGDKLISVCQPVTVTDSPLEQTVAIAVKAVPPI
jgi:protocatechuate 3,4-dioxygenase beta subunit